MRLFAFQELAYAIVVASAYGLLIGILYNPAPDVFIFIVWGGMVLLHLLGIILIVRLEERQQKSNDTQTGNE
ncbi:MAG: hypothetical protein ACFFE8_09135 [Candidatus Heimdallarchaeota archaeon]